MSVLAACLSIDFPSFTHEATLTISKDGRMISRETLAVLDDGPTRSSSNASFNGVGAGSDVTIHLQEGDDGLRAIVDCSFASPQHGAAEFPTLTLAIGETGRVEAGGLTLEARVAEREESEDDDPFDPFAD